MSKVTILQHKSGEIAITRDASAYEGWKVLEKNINGPPGTGYVRKNKKWVRPDDWDEQQRRAKIRAADPVDLHDKLIGLIEKLEARIEKLEVRSKVKINGRPSASPASRE